MNGGSISFDGGDVKTLGVGSFGSLFQAPAGVTNILAMTGASVSSSADVFAVHGGAANLALVDTTAIGGNGVLLSTAPSRAAAAAVTATADHSLLTGRNPDVDSGAS